jgi:hypothetical protein
LWIFGDHRLLGGDATDTDAVAKLMHSFPGCIAALDSALADLIPTLTPAEATRLRILMLSNSEIVTEEMERRAAIENS